LVAALMLEEHGSELGQKRAHRLDEPGRVFHVQHVAPVKVRSSLPGRRAAISSRCAAFVTRLSEPRTGLRRLDHPLHPERRARPEPGTVPAIDVSYRRCAIEEEDGRQPVGPPAPFDAGR
jgi:hypothetical protein